MSFGKIILALLLADASANAAPKKEDPAAEVKKAARELFLDNKRPQAISMLLKLQPAPTQEVLRLSERFLTETAQREFETAESLRFGNSPSAEAGYQKALEVEPDNLAIRQSLLLLFVEKDKCDLAQKELAAIDELYPEHPRRSYFTALLSRCRGNDFQVPIVSPAKDTILPRKYYDIQEIYSLLKRQQTLQAEQNAEQLLETEPSPPDVYYWKWKIGEERGAADTEDLKKYIQVCKSSGEVQRRKFSWDPYYCSELQVAEEILRKEEASQI